MSAYAVKPLDAATWNDFARLVEKHNGVFGGCWCMSFHEEGVGRGRTAARNRSDKERRVREGRAHAALVYRRSDCLGWCQFGPTEELPRIKNARSYREGLVQLPRWRITCFFVDRDHRRQGVASAALAGALTEIARLGGGSVESYPAENPDRKGTVPFAHNGTVAMFERQGFRRVRLLGKNTWVVARTIRATTRRTSP